MGIEISAAGDGSAETVGLHSALLAEFRQLHTLRYDFPLVLCDTPTGPEVHSLCGMFNQMLSAIAPRDSSGEELRQFGLQLEQRIREAQFAQPPQPFSEVWNKAATALQKADADDHAPALLEKLQLSRPGDGLLVDCTEEAPSTLIAALWRSEFMLRMQGTHHQIRRLIEGLEGLLRSAELNSPQGRSAARLRQSIGDSFRDAIDFDGLSQLLDTPSQRTELSNARRQRIGATLKVLRNQQLFPSHEHIAADSWQFERCQDALDAFSTHLPDLIALMRAMRIAELDLNHGYRQAVHDSFFAQFSEDDLTPDDFAAIPPFLIISKNPDRAEQAHILQALSTELPIKILVQHDDLLHPLSLAAGRFSMGAQASQLGRQALSLDEVVVLQLGSAQLYQLHDWLRRGLRSDLPTLINLHAGLETRDFPPYLLSAAAIESRAFPSFCFTPTDNPNTQPSLDISSNPRSESDWTRHQLNLSAAPDMRRQTLELPFSFADFVSLDVRYQHHFKALATDELSDCCDVPTWLANNVAAKHAVVQLVDSHNKVQPCRVDDAVLHACRRCAESWHKLQTMADATHISAPQDAPVAPEEINTTEAPLPAPINAPAGDPTPAPGSTTEAYIETPRCTTCEECVAINPRMFVFDGNKQAYIADRSAGSYRELVEAAESCQVSIIHPGEPIDANEPDLDSLRERAKPFI